MRTLVNVFNLFVDRKAETVFIYRTGVRRFVYSYQQLSDLALRFNSWLEQQNIQTGDRVALWAPNSPWWAVAYWGCVSRGAIVVPVDFMSGQQRAQQIINLSQSKLIIQSQYKADRLTSANNVFEIEQLEFILNKLKPANTIYKAQEEDIVEIVYTSGTTGNPKGVVLTHKNLITNIDQVLSQIEIKPSYKFLSLLPLSHMFEQLGGFLAPLTVGGSVVYLRTMKPSAMSEAFRQEDISVMMAVPRILQSLKDSVIRELENKKIDWLFSYLSERFQDKSKQFKRKLFFPIYKKFGPNFKFFVSGAAPLYAETFKFWNNLGFIILEGYGLTECSPVLTANTLDKQVSGSVGAALPGVDLRIRDGEIQARGANVFSGYWDNLPATQLAFTVDGWFKTGDLGEFNREGNLFIKGRSKELIVTSGGINVYPDELEQVINDIPGVVESCVIGHDQGWTEEVHAVLILEANQSADEIIQIANRQLDPKQRITSYTVWPESAFPKTTTLKIKKYIVKEQIKNQTNHQVSRQVSKLIKLIAYVTKKPVAEINSQSFLVSELGLSSIARLELANLIELEFRLDLDDSLINLETKVSDLQRLVDRRISLRQPIKSRRWVHQKSVRLVRYTFNQLLSRWFMKLYFSIKAVNADNLKKLNQPVIFIANHTSFLDGPSVYLALPGHWRKNYSAVVYEDFFFNKKTLAARAWSRLWFELISFAGGMFLATENSSFGKVLEFMGGLIEQQVNILIFPEGERSRDNRLLPFQPGLGQMVKELKVPVMPIKINGAYQVLPRGAFWPWRGLITVEFGQPLYFSHESPEEFMTRARQAIENI